MSSNNCPAVSFFGVGDEEVYGGMVFSHCQARPRCIEETGFHGNIVNYSAGFRPNGVVRNRACGPVSGLPVQ